MKKKWQWIVIAVLGILFGVCAAGWGVTHKTSKERKATIEFQRVTIDSLMALPPAEEQNITIEMHMAVTDKSKVDVNGKGNSGTINVPSERKYVVEMDSTSLNIFRTDK